MEATERLVREARKPGANGQAVGVVDTPPVVPPLPKLVTAAVQRLSQTSDGETQVRQLAEMFKRLPDEQRLKLHAHVNHLVGYMLELGASDIDMGGPASNGFVWYRVHGDKRPYPETRRYSCREMTVLFMSLLNDRQIGVLLDRHAVDFSWELAVEGDDNRRRFRATMYFESDTLALNMRAITDQVFPLKSLGFGPIIERGLMFRHERDGLTLVTGVTGSGKSSTLDAVIDANNRDSAAHIVIVGQPIEYVHASQRSIVRHREVGRDVKSFKDGIVQALRQDPDIVVIGEMRDPETISSALEITDSGHKVFSTLHTSSAVESIDRIIAEYPPHEQERVRFRLADVLRCVISQKLLPKLGGGRVLAKEVLWMTSSSRAAIKNDNTSEIYQMMWEGSSDGQITLEQDLALLVRKRKIKPDDALSYANNKRRMKQLL